MMLLFYKKLKNKGKAYSTIFKNRFVCIGIIAKCLKK